jgi:hypothetical protein
MDRPRPQATGLGAEGVRILTFEIFALRSFNSEKEGCGYRTTNIFFT